MTEAEYNVDLVEEVASRRQRERHLLDLAGILFNNPHARLCPNYKHFVSKSGVVYCEPCGINVGSLNDHSPYFCERCTCPKTCHKESGECQLCGNPCGRDGVMDDVEA